MGFILRTYAVVLSSATCMVAAESAEAALGKYNEAPCGDLVVKEVHEATVKEFVENFLTVLECSPPTNFRTVYYGDPEFGMLTVEGLKSRESATFELIRAHKGVVSRVPVYDMYFTADQIKSVADLATTL